MLCQSRPSFLRVSQASIFEEVTIDLEYCYCIAWSLDSGCVSIASFDNIHKRVEIGLLVCRRFLFCVGHFCCYNHHYVSFHRDRLSIVRRIFCGVGDNVKKVPFHFTIKLPKPLKERVIVTRDNKGRITSSKVPSRTY